MAADYVAGIMGGLAGIVVGYPADTVKVRLQTQPYVAGTPHLYTGTFHCFLTILKNESIHGLYKGMTSPLIGVGLINALLFGIYGQTIRSLQSLSPDPSPDGRSPLSHVFVAGCVAGLANTIISCPLELGKIQMQNQGVRGPGGGAVTHSLDRGPIGVLRRIYLQRGIAGCFRGITPTILRETPSYGVYFASYDALCAALTRPGESVDALPPGRLLFAGGISGMLGWISTYPTDVIKTKMQSAGGLHYKTTWQCAVGIYRAEGVAVFGRGLVATLVRAFPTNAATLLTYTLAMRFFSSAGMDDGHHRAGPHERLE